MSDETWLGRLKRQQKQLLDTVASFTAEHYKTQFHPDLSPAGWHLGHCLFTENYWLREVVLEQTSDDKTLKGLYVPELYPKTARGGALPELQALCDWVVTKQQENMHLLSQAIEQANPHRLLQEHYLLKFLGMHYAQHYETVMYVLRQRQLGKEHGFVVSEPLPALPVRRDYEVIPAAAYAIGRKDEHCPYDNEAPGFDSGLAECHIAIHPASNSEFLSFMQDGGYSEQGYWNEAGWTWCREHGATCPEFWRADTAGHWYGIHEHGPIELRPNDPVQGINYYEASAFANWAGARLPHEYEWETAKKQGLLKATGKAWEWCENCFHPYEGFQAYPYAGYSQPYFDGRHFTLRGGSEHTQTIINTDSFRNYYEADKRHQLAGCRLAL